MDTTTSITHAGNATALRLVVGSDSTLTASGTAATPSFYSVAGTIGTTTVTVSSDATTSGDLVIGNVAATHTAATVTLAEAAANNADFDLRGATFTSLTFSLDGSQAITLIAGAADLNSIDAGTQYGLSLTFDGNANAVDVYATTTAPAIASLTISAGTSTGNNTFTLREATNMPTQVAKASITDGSGNGTITGTVGADTINGGAGSDNITGGDGADTIDVGSGTDTVVQDATSSGGVTFVNGTNAGNSATTIDAGDTWTFTALDVITGLSTGDTLTLPDTQAGASVSVSGSTGLISAGTLGDYAYVRGTYTAGATPGAGTFAFSTTGSDWLVLYDDNGDTAGGNVDAVVLVGTATSATTGLVPTIG